MLTMNSYKHSGAAGDLIYSLIVPKFTGGGTFYLHLNQLDWIGKHYYGSDPNPFHQGRMTLQDFEFMRSFMESQDYITEFKILDPKSDEISHNLDRFRPIFVGHPTNYIDIYAALFGLLEDTEQSVKIRTEPWLSVPEVKTVPGKPIVINRTARWVSPNLPEQYNDWSVQGLEDQSVFVGLESEYHAFKQNTGWNIPWQQTSSMLELAEYIAGAEIFIGNQSQCYALAVGLGVPQIHLELRRDLPKDRNECYFPNRTSITYF